MLTPHPPLESHLMLMGAGASGGASFVGPLDAYTSNLAGAWSVARRLLTSYSGSLIRVRRSSDDSEQDIGYTAAGYLDTAALTAFVGANSAYVTKIYDQNASHGYNQEQATASQQPRIVNAGTIEVGTGGKPMANFSSNTMWLNSNAPAIETNATVLAVVNSLAGSPRFAGSGNAFQRNQLLFQSGSYYGNSIYTGTSGGVAGSSTAVVAWKQAGASDRKWQFDGGTEQADNTGTLDETFGVSGWFAFNTGGGPENWNGTGKMSELITYSATLSQAAVQAIQTGQGGLN